MSKSKKHFRVFWNWQNRICQFTQNLLLFKSNTARDEGISANSPTQHWRTAIFWLPVTSSHALFLRRIEQSSQPVLFFKPCLKLLDRTRDLFECNIAHCRSATVLFTACCIRDGVIRCTLFMVLYQWWICQCGSHAVLWLTSVCLCSFSLQNLAVPQDFYSLLSVSMERSYILTPNFMLCDW